MSNTKMIYVEVPCVMEGLPGPCHVCAAAPQTSGYCQVKVGGRLLLVHRVAWEARNGAIPEGMVIDHRCRVRKCMNPDHLRVVTRRVNSKENTEALSAKNAVKTHCYRGHEFTPENTARRKGYRACRICLRERRREARERRLKRACGGCE